MIVIGIVSDNYKENLAKKLFNYLKKRGKTGVVIEKYSNTNYTQNSTELDYAIFDLKVDDINENNHGLKFDIILERFENSTVYDEDKIQELIKDMTERYKGVLCIVRSNKYYMEITDPNATKGAALNFLKDYWGIKKEEILATGDQDNDYEMLKNAGIKVAMGNASKKLKEIADIICPDVKEDGVCEIIERYILCE